MNKNLEKLIKLLPPPPKPKHNTGDWLQVEKLIGTSLPSDFKEFTEVYGSVTICNCMWFHSPFYYVGRDSYEPFSGKKERYIDVLLSGLQQMDDVVDGRQNVPFTDYPNAGGLLPIGVTDNGDVICWITDGKPNEWGVFFWAFPGINTFILKNTNITGFLLGLLKKDSPLFPLGLPLEFFSEENRCLR